VGRYPSTYWVGSKFCGGSNCCDRTAVSWITERQCERPTVLAKCGVKIDNFSFRPQTVTVPVGGTVTWTNRDDTPHTVVSTEGVFKSKVRDTDEKFSYTFTKAGKYPYYCSVHPKMTGRIIVQ
jgi:plastocyanin